MTNNTETIKNQNIDTNSGTNEFTSKDLVTDQEIRWCPGCGDYSILKQAQKVIPELGIKKEDIVFISGIGCAARFPYYMNTYGMHSIHGRGPAIATGLKATRPELSVWVITGDGDGLSIGGNHFMHMLRRNLDLNVLLFNNEIYGLTKGQYSPTSESGKVTKSTPYGSLDHPVNPVSVSLGSDGTFVARTMDRDPKHLQYVLDRGAKHKGTSMIEIYQNCNVFNDGAFFTFTDKATKPESTVFLDQGKPLIFGENQEKGVKFNCGSPEIVNLEEDHYSEDDLWIHDEQNIDKANMLSNFLGDPQEGSMPRPFGVIYAESKPTYEDMLKQQINDAFEKKGKGSLNDILRGDHSWKV